jgi:ABC-type transport system substrate-binding protein
MHFSLASLEKFRLPLLWTLGIVALFLFFHLIGVYIYKDGKLVGIPGGSVNIGMVGKAPENPNPLTFGQDKQHDLILSYLFRWLIRYNHGIKRYEGDLARCNIDDLSSIECTLTGSGKWSDGTMIQTDDVIATVQAFKDNPPNEKMKAFLSKLTVVSKKAGIVTLSAPEKNSLMLDILTYPILRSDMIERIRTERLGPDGYVTSWPYAFLEKEKNSQYGYERMTIVKNEKNENTGWLDKYNFLFFPDASSLEKGADILGIIVPPIEAPKMLLGPRFREQEYTMQEYLGLFLNTDTLSNSIRKHLLLNAESWLSGSVVESERSAMNLFPYDKGIKLDRNFADVLKEAWYQKVDERLALLEKNNGMLTGVALEFSNNVYIDTPSKKNTIFSEVADGTITIAGNVPVGTKNVIINGYILQEFLPWNNRFTYKVSLEKETLTEWKNIYVLEFESVNGTRIVRDTFTVYYSRDKAQLDAIKAVLEKEALEKENTPEKVTARLNVINGIKEKLKPLNPRFYYNDKYEPFTVKLTYLSDPASLEKYATLVGNTLTSLGLEIETTAVSGKDFSAMLQKWEKNYDMLLIGFEATGRFSRIGQIFLSSEAKNGINFSKIQSKTLDALFGNLRTADTTEKTNEVMKEIGDYMKTEAFFLPISSPLHVIYIDKNLKWILPIDTFQDVTTIKAVTEKASIKEEFNISLEGKSFSDFWRWLFEIAKP